MNERQYAQLRSIVHHLEGVTETIKMLSDGIDLGSRAAFEITSTWTTSNAPCATHARPATCRSKRK